MKYQPWYERWPDLLEWERKRFEYRRLPWAIDGEAKAHGYLMVRSEVSFRGDPLPIKVVYPSETPELPPTVIADPVLERHQQPFRGNFCLLARPEDDWNAREWGAADLIHYQLIRLLRDSEAGQEEVRRNEAPMPEPRSATYKHGPDSVVVIPEELVDPSGDEGTFVLRRLGGQRFLLTQVDTAVDDSGLVSAFPTGTALRGRWRRLASAPSDGPSGDEILRWVRTAYPTLLRTRPIPAKLRGNTRIGGARGPEIVALLYPEEATPDGRSRTAWMFLSVEHGTSGTLLHAQVTSVAERMRRIPELSALPAMKAVVVGAGSLGGEVAVQLARAGMGELHVVDHDRFEVNNTVRHVLGVDAAGMQKAPGVATHCKRANPYCEVVWHDLHFGDTGDPSPLERFYDVLDGAHIVVETTGVNQLMLLASRVAWEFQIPAVSCWLTGGSFAGEVVRIVPGRTACGSCFVTRQVKGEALRGEEDPDANAYVQGCLHPTTTGAGFEASEIAAIAARTACATLTTSYPDPAWDHAVANFRRLPDDQEYPRFTVEALAPSRACEECSVDVG